MRGAALFAALAMLPALCGPVLARAATFELASCGGGTLTVPLRDDPLPPATEPCCAKGCHASRKRLAPERAN